MSQSACGNKGSGVSASASASAPSAKGQRKATTPVGPVRSCGENRRQNESALRNTSSNGEMKRGTKRGRGAVPSPQLPSAGHKFVSIPTQRALNRMSYRELQALARRCNISARLKRIVLLQRFESKRSSDNQKRRLDRIAKRALRVQSSAERDHRAKKRKDSRSISEIGLPTAVGAQILRFWGSVRCTACVLCRSNFLSGPTTPFGD